MVRPAGIDFSRHHQCYHYMFKLDMKFTSRFEAVLVVILVFLYSSQTCIISNGVAPDENLAESPGQVENKSVPGSSEEQSPQQIERCMSNSGRGEMSFIQDPKQPDACSPKPITEPLNGSSNSVIVSQDTILEQSNQIRPIGVDVKPRSKNYASAELGAKVVETNPEAKKSSHIINEMIDEYMLNPCKAKIWFVVELCESIQATHIKIANYELFSSTPKDFTVYFSDIYPTLDWKLVGQFTASDSRTLQSFDLNQVGFGKFIRVEMHTHYGNEHYCPISEVKVYGNSMVDEYDNLENLVDVKPNGLLSTGKTNRKSKRKTSAYKVYYSMMTEPNICGLSRSLDKNDSDRRHKIQQKEPPLNVIQPQPTQQPVVNRTTPLKPSIFVELSNKVKALETSLKLQKEDMERRLNETELKFEKFSSELRSSAYKLALIVIAYCVYKLMLDFM